jgi:tetratricopeptide (TPR) repeat protein
MMRASVIVSLLGGIASSFFIIIDSAEAACRRGYVACGRGCMPRGAVCCGRSGYCQRGYICLKGSGCLSRDSERVCRDGRYCNEGFRCTDEYQCVLGRTAQAEEDCQADDPDRAISGCSIVIDTTTDEKTKAMAYQNRGAAHSRKTHYKAALADFDKSVELWPRAKSYWARGVTRADIALDDMLFFADSGEDYDRIIADFTKAIELDGAFARSVNIYAGRADAYAMKDDADRAISDWNEAISIEPGKAALYRRRASSYMAKKQYDAAIADYGKAMELEPGKTDDYVERAQAYRWKEDKDRAIADFSKAIELNPKSSMAYGSRGHTYLAKGEIDLAIADFGKNIEIEPDNYMNYETRAKAHLKKNDRERAVADYRKALEILSRKIKESPDFADMYYGNRGEVHLALEDYDSALVDFTKAMGKSPSWLDFDRRARAHAAKGDFTQAVADYAKAVEVLEPNEADLRPYRLRELGYARFNGGQFKEAAADLLKAIELQDDATAMLYRFLARARAGETTAAADLEANAGRLKTKAWPYAVIELYLGRRSPEATLDVATTDEQRCEAHFYVGGWQMVKGDTTAASRAFKTAAQTCPKDLTGYRSAHAELLRLAN